ncbi:S-adenosyl-l-methionine hydroxide adenosyltransferase family protein [Thermoanaerobacterium sp. RBIITD]|uniref:SAM hydrolase/SAM-dependent halogenase family protein n=1 Tax=Thermoanaerobacterium sp. RBIITD TaxID=1550240 RepID=UPI000BB6E577|nr:S-adenosyl-l-methionine hydroxide adenosyltransferase family protein [Thermoanaerobacterium sp. RBIITD]SNX52754.1 hypothetical protein SAMN05660242_0193 [Thermoanaerobacterium sp. RBIITD]
MYKLLVFQSDFGMADGAVAAMLGVALGVHKDLKISHITHDITPYNIWEASYRLFQTVPFWPEGTVFVSIVDPGVGTSRKSIVAFTKDGHYIVTPDNGTLTHLKKFAGITKVREIDISIYRRPNSEESHTFHGRDIYAYIGAKLASGQIDFIDVGPEVPLESIVELETRETVKTQNSIKGNIDILDVRFGNVWTNITKDEFLSLGFKYGERVEVIIKNGSTIVYNNRIPFGKSFMDVYISEQIIYVNSLLRMAIAINQGNFAKAYNIGFGLHWTVKFIKSV